MWFKRKNNDDALNALSDAIAEQTTKVAGLEARLKQSTETLALSRDYAAAKKQLVDLQIELDRVKEEHEREKREIEHMVGLEKKRQEFELDAGKRDAELKVREENLDAEKARFKDDVEFIKKQTEEQREMTKAILARLPDVNVMMGSGSKDN